MWFQLRHSLFDFNRINLSKFNFVELFNQSLKNQLEKEILVDLFQLTKLIGSVDI